MPRWKAVRRQGLSQDMDILELGCRPRHIDDVFQDLGNQSRAEEGNEAHDARSQVPQHEGCNCNDHNKAISQTPQQS